jgi:hypothetical protein
MRYSGPEPGSPLDGTTTPFGGPVTSPAMDGPTYWPVTQPGRCGSSREMAPDTSPPEPMSTLGGIMDALATPGNWDRASGNDILARDATGKLWLYPGTNTSGLQTRRQAGSGWQGFSYLG